MSGQDVGDEWAFVDLAIVQQEDDLPWQLSEEGQKEVRDMFSLEVLLLKPHVESHPLSDGGYCEGSQSGDPVMSVAIKYDRRLALGCPSSMASRNEHKPAFVKEYEVGTKFCAPFF